MPKNIWDGNRTRTGTPARVEHPSPSRRTASDCSFARSAGRADAKIGVGNLTDNLTLIFSRPGPRAGPPIGSAFQVGVEIHNDQFQSRPSPRLPALISVHKACFARRERTVNALQNEVNARSQIIGYEPRNRGEALERLSYLFAVIATANDWLEDDELEELLTMIRNY